MPPDYFVIIDLEASGNDSYNVNTSEITEWPWVVYELRSRLVVDAKQVFVAPQWSPNPNPSPDQVSNLNIDVAFAPSLSDAVAKFDSYLYSSFAMQNKTFCLLADGPWDLRHLLLLEAARKAVTLASHFRSFFNLRTDFRRCYPRAPDLGDRRQLAEYLSVPVPVPDGGAAGLESCHVIADIVARMQHDGYDFSAPEVIPDFDWASMSARVPAVAVPVAAAVPVGGIVRLRGLPWTCVEQDIADFFVGIPIVPKGIHFVKNAHGKATGEAFVQLHAPESVQHALQRHKQTMGRRYIEVFKSNPVDMSNHLGRADARRQLHQQQVLHAQAHKAAAAAAASAANVVAAAASGGSAPSAAAPVGVYGGSGGGGAGGGIYGPTGGVSLSNWPHNEGQAATAAAFPGGALPAAAPFHHHTQLLQAAGGRRRGGGKRGGSVPGSGTGKSYVLKVRNLPRTATSDDVARIFDGLEMLGDGVHLVPEVDGTPCSGDAFVEFTSETWAKKALALSPLQLGSRTISVHKSSMGELGSTLYPPEFVPADGDNSVARRPVSMSVFPAKSPPSVESASAVINAVVESSSARERSRSVDGAERGEISGTAAGVDSNAV